MLQEFSKRATSLGDWRDAGSVRVRIFFGRNRQSRRRPCPSPEHELIQDNTKRVRVNRQIRISPLRVIAADGSQMGILDLDAALAWAEKCPAAAWGAIEIRPSAVRFAQGGWVQA